MIKFAFRNNFNVVFITSKLCVNPTMPCLLAVYDGKPCKAFKPAIDATFRMVPPRPPFAMLMYSIAVYVVFIMPICKN